MPDRRRLDSLRRWNIGVGLAHLGQAIAILVLGNGFSIAVQGSVQTGPPGSALTSTRPFFDLRFSVAIAVFLLLAAADHLLRPRRASCAGTSATSLAGINYARWAEYAVSASVMIVLIAMLTGITDLYALIALFGVNAAMILFGLLMERANRPGEPVTWWPFACGCVAGAVPWIAITTALIVAGARATAPPASSTASSSRCSCSSTASP